MNNNVEFEGDVSRKQILYSRLQPSSVAPKLVNLVLKTGIVKTEQQANYIILGIVIVCIIVSIVLFRSQASVKVIDREQVLQTIIQQPQ